MKEFERDRKDYHAVGKCIPKKDSEQLLLGKPVFMDDILKKDSFTIEEWCGDLVKMLGKITDMVSFFYNAQAFFG